jgi:TIR domain
MSRKVFISHAGEDTWVASQIAEQCERLGATTFLDEKQIAVGADFEADILSALKTSDEFLLLATPWSLGREYVWLELGGAWRGELYIVALLLGVTATEIQSKTRVPSVLKKRNLIPLNSIDRYFDELAKRVKGVATL